MNFPLIHTGRRFFFFTFVVEGRRAILSRLERGVKRPVLTPLGERVVALWRQLHEIEPCFTASDFVIMPDHVHLLLIVNSVGEFRFNPLVFAHWFMRTTGALAPPNPAQGVTRSLWAPPNPAQGVTRSLWAPPNPRRWDIPPPRGFGGAAPVDREAAQAAPAPVGCEAAQAAPAPVDREAAQADLAPVGCEAAQAAIAWSRDYWIDISFDSRQLAAIRRYIKMNPARYFWKLDNPDMFRFRDNLRHPVLDPALSWSAVGDITILASPFLYLVRLTMKKTVAELEDEIAAHIERAKHGWTPVCGFISPGEREFERRLKALPQSRWIKTVPYGLPERYDPSVEDSRWLAAHRQLVLSSFDRNQIAPFKITRPGCLAMNERIAAMVQRTMG